MDLHQGMKSNLPSTSLSNFPRVYASPSTGFLALCLLSSQVNTFADLESVPSYVSTSQKEKEGKNMRLSIQLVMFSLSLFPGTNSQKWMIQLPWLSIVLLFAPGSWLACRLAASVSCDHLWPNQQTHHTKTIILPWADHEPRRKSEYGSHMADLGTSNSHIPLNRT